MNVIILCAGFATRMYPLTKNFPKPLLQVAGKPVLNYLIEQIVQLEEISTVHVVSNAKFYDHFQKWHQQSKAAEIFGDKSVHIHNDGCYDNKSRLGAAGDLWFALQKIGKPGRVLVSGGDNIYRFELHPLWQAFLTHKSHCVTALVESNMEKLQKTGVLEIEDDGKVRRLHEKPDVPISQWICPPLYFFQPSIWKSLQRFLSNPGNHDAPGYFIDYLCQKESVHAEKINSTRLDIGCLSSYREADRLLRQSHS